MPPESSGQAQGLFARYRTLIFPFAIITSVLILVAPLPPVVLDMLLACNITVAVVILLTTVYIKSPLEFSVFPAILLGTTLARLVLNVASTRLILSNGASQGTGAAGGVIEAFGEFVAGGQIAIGLTIFVILVTIQFLVITKGATRMSEVAARFALDGMPGKQMAIDADLNAGLIKKEEAKARREEVTQQADFYGAMDGASKFVRGDAIAGIVITVINIVAGLALGMLKYNMEFSKAIQVFTTLTIGDGLVTQVPGFLISLAAGLIATRTSSESNLPVDIVSQLFRHSQALMLASLFLFSLAFTGLPATPMIILSIGCAFVAFSLKQKKQVQRVVQQQEEVREREKRPEAKPEDRLKVHPLKLELGVGLLRLTDVAAGGDLLDRVTRIRHQIAQEMGIILPSVTICDNIRLAQRDYQFKIRDVPVAWGDVHPDGLLAINTGATTAEVHGIDAVEPAYQRPAKWIDPGQKERAELLGYNVVEPTAVIITHLMEIVREHSPQILSRQQVHQLIDNLRESSPSVVEELIPDILKVSQVHQVLNNLLRERVPIRDLESILETLGDYAIHTTDLGILTEYVRNKLSRTICRQYRDKQRVMRVITLDPALEDILSAGFDYGDRGLVIKLSPQVAELVSHGLSMELEKLVKQGHPPVVLCSPQVRAGLKQITQSEIPLLAVIGLSEITRDTEVESVGQVGVENFQPTGTTN